MVYDTSCNGKYGNCTYAVSAKDGKATAIWTSTADGKAASEYLIYLARASSGNCTTDRKKRCMQAREKFCVTYTGNKNCDGQKKKVDNIVDIFTGGHPVSDEEFKQAKDDQDAKAKERNDVCNKKCGPILWDPLCNSAKWQYGCGGSGDLFGNLCEGLPPPFNNCAVVGLGILGVILGFWLLK